ncbi:hypothetical protein V500_09378 [Pseudogymnoascus sp. VKM F-4518 (FW-2643)]|nr:hypothetical protein V500_09378 [Pseudogymnoascus sp. VKM F-4518 (FW-2643)]
MIISRSAACSLGLFKGPNVSHRITTKAHSIEEGTLKHYNPELYYPVHINELFHHRYRTCVKLGYGGYSTVWLSRDETALKVGTRRKSQSMAKELHVLEYLAIRNSVHDGKSWVRQACDTFRIDVPGGAYTCLIWELLCGEHLFGRDNERDALALMIKYLGPPPVEFLKRSDVYLQYLTSKVRNWRGAPLEPTRLKDRLEGGGDIDMFVDFVQPMLSWELEKRPSAAALLAHPWLQS